MAPVVLVATLLTFVASLYYLTGLMLIQAVFAVFYGYMVLWLLTCVSYTMTAVLCVMLVLPFVSWAYSGWLFVVLYVVLMVLGVRALPEAYPMSDMLSLRSWRRLFSSKGEAVATLYISDAKGVLRPYSVTRYYPPVTTSDVIPKGWEAYDRNDPHAIAVWDVATMDLFATKKIMDHENHVRVLFFTDPNLQGRDGYDAWMVVVKISYIHSGAALLTVLHVKPVRLSDEKFPCDVIHHDQHANWATNWFYTYATPWTVKPWVAMDNVDRTVIARGNRHDIDVVPRPYRWYTACLFDIRRPMRGQ